MSLPRKPTGLYGWIKSNDGRSLGLFLAFLLAMQVICAINLFLPLAVLDVMHAPFLDWSGYLIRYAPFVLAGSVLWFGSEFFWHIEKVKKVSGFRFIDNREEPRLCSVIEPLITALGLPIPFVGLIDSPARNAFACGIGRKKAVVVVTRGLLDTLNDEELAAVLAHELSHIKNGDIRLMAATNILMSRLELLNKNNVLRFTPIHVALALAIPVILPLTLAGTFIGHMTLRAGQISRLLIASAREYIADAEAAQLTKNPAALASALVKVEHDYRLPDMRHEDDSMMIAGDSQGEGATHPTVAQRVAALARTTGSMVFNTPGGIREEQWAASSTLSEARAAALLHQLPAARILPRIRSGSQTNVLGMTRNAMIMAAATIGGLVMLHSRELKNPTAIAAKFDIRPLSVIVGLPQGCDLVTITFSATTRKSCASRSASGVYADFEGQDNTLAGWLADVSKWRRAEGFINPDVTLINLNSTEVAPRPYLGVSGKLTGVYALTRSNDIVAVKENGTFSNRTTADVNIMEQRQVGCFWATPIYDEPEGRYSLNYEVNGTSLQDYLNLAQASAENGPPKGSTDEDVWLKKYAEYRWIYTVSVNDFWGFRGLKQMQETYRKPEHAAVLRRMADRLTDAKFTTGLSEVEIVQMESLVTRPEVYVPCSAVRKGYFD
jgi:Zn-dependent protease with chaperone function